MKLKKKQRKILTAILGVICLVSTGLMIRQGLQYRHAAQSTAQAQQMLQTEITEQAVLPTVDLPEELLDLYAVQPPLDEEVQFLLTTSYAALQEVNPDVCGWVYVPGCDISYPLLRSRDNEDYLYIGWDKLFSLSGSIFLECKNNRDLMDFHTIIYGHNMQNGTMFAPLKQYESADFRAQYPYVYVLSNGILRRYQVFSAYEAKVNSESYRLYFEDETRKQSTIDLFRSTSVAPSDVSVTPEDYVLTLSTCTGRGTYEARWVVHTVLDGAWPQ